MGYVELKGPDWKRINHTLATSFSARELSTFVEQEFKDLFNATNFSQGHVHVIQDLVSAANARGQLDTLLTAASNERPFRTDLRAVVLYYGQQSGWSARFETNDLDVGETLQNLIIKGDPYVDTTLITTWLTRVERQVCVVRCGPEHGTGFLIGPDLVLTCYHVVKRYLKGQVPLSSVQVRFDYRRSAQGVVPSFDEGWRDLSPSWTIPHAPFSQADTSGVGDPAPGELDFAVLKLGERVGDETPNGEDRRRGWIDLSADPPLPKASSPALIVQHPRHEPPPPPQMPLKIAWATPGYLGTNANGTRIVYQTSTSKGSSGSPVFDRSLKVYGLHHNRGQIDPSAKDLVKDNRGIPLWKIRAALTEDVRALLVAPPK